MVEVEGVRVRVMLEADKEVAVFEVAEGVVALVINMAEVGDEGKLGLLVVPAGNDKEERLESKGKGKVRRRARANWARLTSRLTGMVRKGIWFLGSMRDRRVEGGDDVKVVGWVVFGRDG